MGCPEVKRELTCATFSVTLCFTLCMGRKMPCFEDMALSRSFNFLNPTSFAAIFKRLLASGFARCLLSSESLEAMLRWRWLMTVMPVVVEWMDTHECTHAGMRQERTKEVRKCKSQISGDMGQVNCPLSISFLSKDQIKLKTIHRDLSTQHLHHAKLHPLLFSDSWQRLA